MSKYRELYPNSVVGTGLITALSALPNVPWADADDDVKKSLEQAFYLRSNFKTVVDSFSTIPEAERPKVLSALFLEKWKKLWETFKLEYDPLAAYTLNEEIHDTRVTDRDDTAKYGRVTDTNSTDTGTVTNDGEANNGNLSSVYGFNSSQPSPTDEASADAETHETETRNLTLNDKVINSGEDKMERDVTETFDHELTKSGNIGYTSPQELLRQQIELWGTPYFNIVFSDIEQFTMILVY